MKTTITTIVLGSMFIIAALSAAMLSQSAFAATAAQSQTQQQAANPSYTPGGYVYPYPPAPSVPQMNNTTPVPPMNQTIPVPPTNDTTTVPPVENNTVPQQPPVNDTTMVPPVENNTSSDTNSTNPLPDQNNNTDKPASIFVVGKTIHSAQVDGMEAVRVLPPIPGFEWDGNILWSATGNVTLIATQSDGTVTTSQVAASSALQFNATSLEFKSVTGQPVDVNFSVQANLKPI